MVRRTRHATKEFVTLGRTVGFGGPPNLELDFSPAGFLKANDEVRAAKGWVVVETPGHTDDSICLDHPDSAT